MKYLLLSILRHNLAHRGDVLRRIGSFDALLTVRDRATPLAGVFLSFDIPQREHCVPRARRVPGLLGRGILSPDDGEARRGDIESMCE